MEVIMTINKYKQQIIVAYILVLAIFSHEGVCQSYSIIDLDKVSKIELPGKQQEESIPDGMLSFNDIIEIKAKSITPYTFDYVPAHQFLNILNGTIFVDLDKKFGTYDLETADEIPNANKSSYFQYSVKEFSVRRYTKNELYKSMFGEYPSKIEYYIASIDQATGDTLWVEQEEYLTIRQAETVSYIGNITNDFIIDNKTGEKLFKLNSSKPFSISDIKEDNGYLYLMKTGISESELTALNLKKGEVVWKVKGSFKSFFLDETRIYTSNQCAIDKMTGRLIWSNNSNIRIVSIVGNYLIGYLYLGEDDPEIFAYNKNTGGLAGYLWSDYEFCTSCLGYKSCNPEFVFAEQGEGNKTAALIKCNDRVYLSIFEVVKN